MLPNQFSVSLLRATSEKPESCSPIPDRIIEYNDALM